MAIHSTPPHQAVGIRSRFRNPADWLVGILLSVAMVFCMSSSAQAWDEDRDSCLILTGLGGVPEYEENFQKWSSQLFELCSNQMGADTHFLDGRDQNRDSILQLFNEIAGSPASGAVWLFIVGHASHDGRDYKFNIKGPDLSGADLANFADSIQRRKVYAVVGTSCSGVLATALAGRERVILTATRSELEKRPPLFLSFFLEASQSAAADTNKDRKVSLKEAFDFAEVHVSTWYEEKGRLQTEHPLLQDEDGPGSLAQFAFLSAPPEQAYRSLEARELAPGRVKLEREIEDLKLRKTEMSPEDYFSELERLLVELAELNEKIRQLEGIE